MSKKQFVRNAAVQMMLHPMVLDFPKEKRCDMAISLSEHLWERLKARGYGEEAKAPKKQEGTFYALIKDQEAFDKCWAKYGREGSLQAAAKAWLAIEESEKPDIYPSVISYLEQLSYTGKAKAHFSTWLNDRRWEGFTKVKEAAKKVSVIDERAQQIRHLEKLLESAKGANKEALEAQLTRLKNG